MNYVRTVLSIISIVCIVGCSGVYSTRPVGEKPHLLTPTDWEGTWIHSEGAVTMRVIDAGKGVLEVAWLEKKLDGLALESYKVYLRESGDWLFGNLENPDRPQHYLWGRVKREEGQLILWIPDLSKFTDLVKKGVLPGKVEESGDVVLDNVTAAHLKLIKSDTHGSMFQWENPITGIRLSK